MEKLKANIPLGITGLFVPPVIYGSSYLGNLYTALPYADKLALIKKWFECTENPVVIDTAGKYGAGLALEIIGKGLAEIGILADDVIISNKLGWYRVPLESDEPTFEPGAWAGLENDAIQAFGYDNIIKCFEQGNLLLGGNYSSKLVSVHDPDEYLLASLNVEDREKRKEDIFGSYKALFELKAEGKIQSVGIGSKDWLVIKELYKDIKFDWVMFANSFTIYNHPLELLNFMDKLYQDGVGIINSAVFHGGFLTGGEKFDYHDVDYKSEKGKKLLNWRNKFNTVCNAFGVNSGDACIHFGMSHPAVASIALNTSRPEKMVSNVEILYKKLPGRFWKALKEQGLIDKTYNYI